MAKDMTDFTCIQWHDLAMDFADHGDYCRKVGRAADSREAFLYGAVCEERAARMGDTQPGKGIMLRSAAWLALEGGVPSRAIQTAEEGLATAPCDRTCNELREVLEAAKLAAEQPEPVEMAEVSERLAAEVERIKRRQEAAGQARD